MNQRKTLPCTRKWCDCTQHYADIPYFPHCATVAEFPNAGVDVVVSLTEAEKYSDPRVTLDVHTAEDMLTVDVSPGQAAALAEVLAALAPEDLIRFAAALAEGARVLDVEGRQS